jgi:hypothetical protein
LSIACLHAAYDEYRTKNDGIRPISTGWVKVRERLPGLFTVCGNGKLSS